jgi:dTDP-4-amino-4,6-dideoxygalactose transaminase
MLELFGPFLKNPSNKLSAAIPMLDLSRQYASIRGEILAAVERACDSQSYILGQEVGALEGEFASLCGAAECVACASGTDALWLALAAAGIKNGDSVITTPFSFFASASSIVRAGARPVFADIDPETLNLDAMKVEQCLKSSSSHKRALMPVHLYGQCADMEGLGRVAGEFGIPIIEDAAQAAGASWNDLTAGAMGLAAAFSFYPTKNLSAFGDAGAVTTGDHALAERVRSLRNHGAKQRYYHDEIGANSRMDSLQAAVLRVKMPYLSQWNQARRERAQTYDRLIAAAGLTRTGANSTAPITLLQTRPQAFHIFHQYVVRAQQRDQLRDFMKERGVGTEIYYPVPLHLQKCFAYLGYTEGDLPEAERAAAEVLALPMFGELEEDEQVHVVETMAEFYS